MNIESAVLARYSECIQGRIEPPCCPVDYDKELLKIIPREIVDRDYGCGDPSRYVQAGDVVLDLGSGSGKICYMAAQLTGEKGRVIGIDMNDNMLDLARKYQSEMAKVLGNDRIEFHKGYIQDLALDVAAMETWLQDHPVNNAAALAALEAWKDEQRRQRPMIPDKSVDLVISNCVLNLVSDGQKRHMVEEIFRVVKPGGRIAISDIVSDEPVPQKLKEDKLLWSGCISGAFTEQAMLEEFQRAGFQAVCYNKWSAEPWQVLAGIEFRSVTITAIKGEDVECLDQGHAVIYRGPFSYVRDDDGHEYPRGERMAVCARTYRMLTETAPYRDAFIGISPAMARQPRVWCAPAGTVRPVSETKGGSHVGDNSGSCCC